MTDPQVAIMMLALFILLYRFNPLGFRDFAAAVARLVSENEAWRGIIIDGAGIGSCTDGRSHCP